MKKFSGPMATSTYDPGSIVISFYNMNDEILSFEKVPINNEVKV